MYMTTDETMFFNTMPTMLPLYEALLQKLQAAYPDMERKVSKTQISLRNRHVFAMVSLPWRRVKGWPKEYLLVSFGLSYRKESPRIAAATEPYPNRWTHHVLLQHTYEVDAELLAWLEEAYQFSLVK